jgi:hypothetical protein
MQLSELLEGVGADHVSFQKLDECASTLSTKTKRGKVETKITFITDEPLTIGGTESLGIVVWINRDAVAQFLAAREVAK